MTPANKAPLYMVTWRCTIRYVGNCSYCSYTLEYAKDTEAIWEMSTAS